MFPLFLDGLVLQQLFSWGSWDKEIWPTRQCSGRSCMHHLWSFKYTFIAYFAKHVIYNFLVTSVAFALSVSPMIFQLQLTKTDLPPSPSSGENTRTRTIASFNTWQTFTWRPTTRLFNRRLSKWSMGNHSLERSIAQDMFLVPVDLFVNSRSAA